MSQFPKVLLIGVDPFNKKNGTGITLSNLFGGWDKNQIAQVYISDITPTTDICDTYYKLNPDFVPLDFYFRKIVKSKNKKEIATLATNTVALNEKEKSLKNILHLNLRALLDFSPIFIPNKLYKWIESFNPDLIYCAFGNYRMINLAYLISLKIDKPIVPHFMDDWITTIYSQNELGGMAKKNIMKKFHKAIGRSNGGLCISDEMAEEYTKRYNLPFTSFVNCVDDGLFYEPQYVKNEIVTIMYVGGLHLNRWSPILDIAMVVEKINISGLKKLELKIYCPAKDKEAYSKKFETYSFTKFEGSLTSKQVPYYLKNASILLHVESFDKNYIDFTKYSLSTKIPQYMAAGKAILGYGSLELASIKHIIKADCGIAITEKNEKKLFENIIQFLNGDLFKYSENAYKFAKKYHSKSYNLERLKKVLKKYSNIN